MKVILTEKPSVARDIAKYLKATRKCDGYLEGNGYQVTWAFGHLVELKEPQHYDPKLKRWSLNTLPFIPDKFELNVISKKHARQQFNIICRLFKQAQELICATDAGREGELIFRYILRLSGCSKKPCSRLWLSSLTHQAIAEAFRNIKQSSHYDNLYAAAQCRSEADWVVGINATRNYTLRYGKSMLWTVGRVQTPVLAMIVSRDREIENFVSEPFWELSTNYRDVIFKYAGKRFSEKKLGEEMLQKVQQQDFCIEKIEHKQERENPPLLYDLTSLQRDMNRRLSLSADATLKILQTLYEEKYITYPRTDSRYLSSDMKPQIPGILQNLSSMKSQEVAQLNLQNLKFSGRIINNQKVSDHHAIIPTGKVPSSLPSVNSKVLDAVITKFIAVFYPPCLKNATIVEACCNEVPFKIKGVTIVDPGWTALYPKPKDKEKEQEVVLPKFVQGEKGEHKPFIEEKKTQPPKSYTENTLLAAMENAGKTVEDKELKEALKERGLGTPATRAAIIETLLQRKYITRDKKSLRATSSGRYLVAIIENENLKSPELTGEWEYKLKQVEYGKLSSHKFMQEISVFIHELITNSGIKKVDETTWGKCPLCQADVIRGRKGYGCSRWKQGCRFVLWSEFQGIPLDIWQIRELLQTGKATTLLADKFFLELNANGILNALPIATNRSSKYDKYQKYRKSQMPSHKKAMPQKETPREAKAPNKAKNFGQCPVCQASVIKGQRNYGCVNTGKNCDFLVPLVIAGKKIGPRTVSTLLKNKKTSYLKGFQRQSGENFEGRLEIQGNKLCLTEK